MKNGRLTRSQKGFTLIEIALGVLIIGLVSYGLMSAFGEMYKIYKYRESGSTLEYAKKSMMRFVEVNHFMPCPDTDGDGRENRNGNACAQSQGDLPFQDLGLHADDAKDAWGVPIKYAVVGSATSIGSICNATPRNAANYFCKVNAPLYDDLTPPTSSEHDPNTLSIFDRTPDGASPAPSPVSEQLVAIIYSLGKNGRLAEPANPDEKENVDGDSDFVQKKYSDDPYFDDQILSISGYEIKRPQDYRVVDIDKEEIYKSKFSDQHTKIANLLNKVQSADRAAILNRLIKEDKKLFSSEDFMIYRDLCAKKPESLNDGNKDVISGNLSNGKVLDARTPNLEVAGDVTGSGYIRGGNESNTVWIGGNMFGSLKLENGNNNIVIKGSSSGDIISGSDDDTIRVCGERVTSDDTETEERAGIEFKFYKNLKMIEGASGTRYWAFADYMGGFSYFYSNVAVEADVGTGRLVNIGAYVTIDDYPDNFYGWCDGYWKRWASRTNKFCLNSLDYEGSGMEEAIQPSYKTGARTDENDEIWLKFKIYFFDMFTGRRISVPFLRATAVDLDGWRFEDGSEMPEQYEYAIFYDPYAYQVENPTYLAVTQMTNPLGIKAETTNPLVTHGSTIDFTETMITTYYNNIHSFSYTIGLDKKERGRTNRINSIWFGQPPYKNSTPVAVNGDINAGSGQDEVLIGSSTTRPTILGDGDNYAYFFDNSLGGVIGSDGDDDVSTLGNLGYPAPMTNSNGWDLRGGNNSARVGGDCYAPITVGDGDDVFIFKGDVDRDCGVEAQDGNNIISVDGALKVDSSSGTGNDVWALNDIASGVQVRTGGGDDIFQINGKMDDSSRVYLQSGNDRIIFVGKTSDMGSGSIINGGSGNDTIELPSVTLNDWNTNKDNIRSKIINFETIKLADGVI